MLIAFIDDGVLRRAVPSGAMARRLVEPAYGSVMTGAGASRQLTGPATESILRIV
jgi:hypothetical protein